ncbi:MAG: endonuclease [Ignavibacteriaceae bacterium]
MKRILFVLTLIYSLNIFAQISVNPDSLFFPQTLTGATDSLSFYVVNHYNHNLDIQIKNLKAVHVISDSVLEISANDSNIVWIKYSPDQNITDDDLIFITGDDSTIGLVTNITGSGKFGDSYDATTFNLFDSQLKTTLTQLVSGHTSLGYNLARDYMFMEIDNKKVNGQGATQNTLECVYIGRLAVGYVDRADAQTNYNFNTEHTWPQSNFSEAEPMKSDLYHLYPTDNPANGVRSNYPFGKVVSNITWDSAGSKLGTNAQGQIVFEPRDVHKGNVSRSMFYFITRYPDNYGGFLTQTQENVFREWNKLDTVGAVESARNNAIAALQKKRNPFIDHPEFVDRIYSFITNNVRPTTPELNVLPLTINFESTLINNLASQSIYIANSGSGKLVVDSIIISDARFNVNFNNTFIEPYSSKNISLQFIPDSIKNYSSVLTVYSNAGTKQIEISGFGVDNAVNVDDKIITALSFSLEQNYPNPFNPATYIQYTIGDNQFVKLIIYDLLGREIETLVNQEKPAGIYKLTWNAANLPSGVYFYKLQAGSYTSIKKMLLLK